MQGRKMFRPYGYQLIMDIKLILRKPFSDQATTAGKVKEIRMDTTRARMA